MSSYTHSWLSFEPVSCPFLDQNGFRCWVSTSCDSVPASRQSRHCLTDDHDQCPFYLAKLLRQSQAKSSESLLRGLMHK